MNRYEQLMTNSYITTLRHTQFILALVIYTTLLLTPNPQLVGPTLSDTLLHALGNTLLMMSTWVASGGRYRSAGPFIFVIPFSLFIELAQGLTDNRTPELSDIGANFTGAVIGFAICMILNRITAQLRKYPVPAAN